MVQDKIETYIVFKNGEGWRARLLKDGFEHLVIVACDGINWIMFNPSLSHLEWEILPIQPNDHPFYKYFLGDTVVRINAHHELHRKKCWIGRLKFMSCVLLAKYFLGIKSYSITPYQLCKYLIKKNIGEHYYGW